MTKFDPAFFRGDLRQQHPTAVSVPLVTLRLSSTAQCPSFPPIAFAIPTQVAKPFKQTAHDP